MAVENSTPKIVHAGGVYHGGGGGGVGNPSLRFTLTLQHLTSADFFATQAADIEDKARVDGMTFSESTYNEIAPRHAAYVIGSILAAVAFLEAAINDLFAFTVDPSYTTDIAYKDTVVGALTPQVRQCFADAWDQKDPLTGKPIGEQLIKETNALVKMTRALYLAGIPLTRAEKSPRTLYNKVHCLIELRNYLTHSFPSTTTTTENLKKNRICYDKESEKIVQCLRVNGVQEGTLGVPQGTMVVAQTRYLNAHCARWGVRSSAGFTQLFYDKLGITAYPDRLKDLAKKT